MKSNSLERTIRNLKVWKKKSIEVLEWTKKYEKDEKEIQELKMIVMAFEIVIGSLSGIKELQKKSKSNKQ